MQLGAFSVSLAVKDLTVSKAFYQALGFETFAGDPDQGWLILKNGDTLVGLFQGMLDRNMLTFNPGWDQDAKPLDSFTDIRDLQAMLKAKGMALGSETDPDGSGPAHITLTDPDGNPVLIDQHR